MPDNEDGAPAPALYPNTVAQNFQSYTVSVLVSTVLFILIFIAGTAWTTAVSKKFENQAKLARNEAMLRLGTAGGHRGTEALKLKVMQEHQGTYINKYFMFAAGLSMLACAMAILVGVISRALNGRLNINISEMFAG